MKAKKVEINVEELIGQVQMIYELKEECQKSIESIEGIVGSQKELSSIIKKAKGKVYDFSDLIKSFDEEIKGYKLQIEDLSTKIAYCDYIIEKYEAGRKPEASEEEKAYGKALEDGIKLLINAFGLVKSRQLQEVDDLKAKKQEETLAKAQKNEQKDQDVSNVLASNVSQL